MKYSESTLLSLADKMKPSADSNGSFLRPACWHIVPLRIESHPTEPLVA